MSAPLNQKKYEHWIKTKNRFKKGHPFGKRFKKGIIPWNKNIKGIHLSPKSEFKKGIPNYNNRRENAGNKAMHDWVRQWKGKPNHCEICGIKEKRMYHWANKDHSYKRNLDDYISMCVPCHRKYDYEKNKN